MQVAVPGAKLDVSLASGFSDSARRLILAWVKRSALAIETFYAAFPVDRLDLRVQSVSGKSGVIGGVTFGSDPPLIRVTVGEGTTERQFDEDWVLTHELVHLALPSLPHRHQWAEEGLATYVEPLARLQAGQMTPLRYWSELMQGLPKGQPGTGDHGLDHTHTWGRTYWGGALFFFVADVQIREKSRNRLGLQQALRGIMRAGGSIKSEWSLRHSFAMADKAVAFPALTQLYRRWNDRPVMVPLQAIWEKLGVVPHGDSVVFDDAAPSAELRRAMAVSAGSR